jgi:hypothetical protein
MCCTVGEVEEEDDRSTTMTWMTRSSGRVDRIACSRLTERFVDRAPEFLFLPEDQFVDGT